MRRSSWVAMFSATSCASVSALRTSTMLRKTSFLVNFWRSFFTVSMPAPRLPMTMPGRAVWTLTFTLLAARSISTLRDAGVVERLLHELADADVLVQPLGVVLVLEPLGVPGLDDAEAEPDRMDFLTQCASP